MSRGGSSPLRSPNDDRSDVMNPNNDDYGHDQANRFGDGEDWNQHGGATGRSGYEVAADRLRDRIYRNEIRKDQAARDRREAERRYWTDSLPWLAAQDEYGDAERKWQAACEGGPAYETSKSRYCASQGGAASKAASKRWNAAQTAWKAAEEAHQPALDRLEAAMAELDSEREACDVQRRGIDAARRRF
jgi:hypothetical protein